MQSEAFRQAIGPKAISRTPKFKWFGHVSRLARLAKTILQGTVQGGGKTGRENAQTISCRLMQTALVGSL